MSTFLATTLKQKAQAEADKTGAEAQDSGRRTRKPKHCTPVQQSVMLNVSYIYYCSQLSRVLHLLTTERSKKAPSYRLPTTLRPLSSLVESRSFTQINLLAISTCDIWDVRVRAHFQTLPPCSLLGNFCDHAKPVVQ